VAQPARPESRQAGSAPHSQLDEHERGQAEEHASPRALVIHEVLREQGEEELKRPVVALAWSGLAAGMSLGFSFLGLALMRSALPDAPWAPLVDSIGYTVGFLVVILGRQALFTESTLTAVLPVLVRRNRKALRATLRYWAIVLSCNLVGTYIFAGLISVPSVFPAAVEHTMAAIATEGVADSFMPTLIKAMLAGWLIALMVWLLPSARTAKIFVIMLLTYLVGIGHFSHVIAGSVEAAYGVFAGLVTVRAYLASFLIPTLLGNVIGGVAMVALLNHAPLVQELEGADDRKKPPTVTE
jgi:formate/nitrite transporter FocA (FNT family)